jgi:hypothetical protein
VSFEIKEANYIEGHKIKLRFEDGSILDIDYFKIVRLEYGTWVWGEGQIDIAPETLYVKATAKPLTYNAMTERV